ncbi:hypothetical protein [Roseateles toxinivorans]|uniref:Uncharacterized protein n=1 Tax=Roseateles toxinivorans TaxID=270368 RepID=A0A4R6QUF1_9BURK|nr:hypothetical protein [Roseateles toxinivorans]TDP74155.1 hypothetical protein DES47_101207 [Roseateles toxinivorans]
MPEPSHRIFTTRSDFIEALRQGLELAAEKGCREMWWCDSDYADWPLSEPAVLDALTRWCLPHRRLVMVAQTYDEVRHSHSRFVQWRTRFSHVLDARQYGEDGDETQEVLPTLMLAPTVVTVRLFDKQVWRGSVSYERADEIRARDLVDAIAQRSTPSFASTTLGL